MNCTANVDNELPETPHGPYPRLVTTSASEVKDQSHPNRHHHHRTSRRLTSCLRGEREEAEGNLYNKLIYNETQRFS